MRRNKSPLLEEEIKTAVYQVTYTWYQEISGHHIHLSYYKYICCYSSEVSFLFQILCHNEIYSFMQQILLTTFCVTDIVLNAR